MFGQVASAPLKAVSCVFVCVGVGVGVGVFISFHLKASPDWAKQ